MPLVDDIIRKYAADQALERAGSVMAPSRVAQRAQESAQGPLMSTVLDMLKMGGLDPSTVGGPGGGTASHLAGIMPKAWLPEAKGGLEVIQPEAKAALNMIADKFPEFFKRVLQSPESLLADVRTRPQLPGALGQLDRLNPLLNKLSIREDVTAGDPNRLMEVVMHELQHHLNVGRVTGTAPRDASTIGTLLHDILPKTEQGSLNKRLGELGQDVGLGPAGYSKVEPAELAKSLGYDWTALSPERKAQFTEMGLREGNPMRAASYKIPGTYIKGQPWGDFLQQTVMDEGLAHLAEKTAYPPTPETQPLHDLAAKLGVGATQEKSPLTNWVEELTRGGFQPGQ